MHQQEQDFKIPLKDLVSILKKKWPKVVLSSLLMGIIFGAYVLLKPAKFAGEGTFLEKLNTIANSNEALMPSLLANNLGGSNKSEAKAIMSSKKLHAEVAKTLNLQANLIEDGNKPGPLDIVYENLIIEYNHLGNIQHNPIKDNVPAIIIEDTQYAGDFPLVLKIEFDVGDIYHITEPDGKIKKGKIGTLFATEEGSFKISRRTEDSLFEKKFQLTLLPLGDVVKKLSKEIRITMDKDNPSLLKITYQNHNRMLACNVINQLMQQYQNHLQAEHERVASIQIAYLNRREKEMGEALISLLEKHAHKLSSEITSMGYANAEKALDFFTGQMHQYRTKLFGIDLNMQILKEILDKEPDVQMDAYVQASPNSPLIATMLEEFYQLKHEEDALEQAVRRTSKEDHQNWRLAFFDQIAALENIRKCSKDASGILAQLDEEDFSFTILDKVDNPHYLIADWINQFHDWRNNQDQAPGMGNAERQKPSESLLIEQFRMYLKNLTHFLQVSEKTIQDRLAHQQIPEEDFQGINLKTANQLYVSYIQELNEIEAKKLQYNFLLDELNDPDFEISSLSSIISDPVTRELVQNAGELVLALHDDANRTAKEKDRMKNDLQIKRRFLTFHLKQTLGLLDVQIGLLKDKIGSLQNETLELIRQRSSIFEKQLSDSIKTHITNLEGEKSLISENEQNLREEMATLPQKRVSEKMIDQQLDIHAAMIGEISRLVESKNISSNLDVILSAPIDLARLPAKPRPPNFFLFSVLGIIIGGFLSSAAIIMSNMLKGFPISKENLELAGLHVSGYLSRDLKENRKTMETLTGFLCQKHKAATSLLFVNGSIHNCVQGTAHLLQNLGYRVLLIQARSVQSAKEDDGHRSSDPFSIAKGKFCDFLYYEGKGDALGLPFSKNFQELMLQLKEKYDWLIIDDNGECLEALIPAFDCVAIVLKSQSIKQLNSLIQTIKNEGKAHFTSFLIVEDT